MSRGEADDPFRRRAREMVKEDRRQARQALGLGGTLVLVVGGLLALALLIWVLVAGWPLLYITLGLLIAGLVMKTRRRKLLWAALAAFVVMCVVATVQGVNERGAKPASQASAPAAVPAPVVPLAPAAPPVAAAAPTAAAPVPPALTNPGVQTVLGRVVDGDTFFSADGAKVRILGIDSCEATTPGGRDATETVKRILAGNPITLRTEPGVDKDQWGRILRYVSVPSGDVGEMMVAYNHTAVYAGKNDAAPSYVARLRTLDNGGRNCAGPPPPPKVNVDVPEHHDDHHESRFCRKHWYC